MSEAWAGLLRSRKFWLAVTDFVVSLVLLIVGEFVPSYKDVVVQIIAMIQPLVLLVIAAICVEDFAEKLSKK